MDGGRGLQHPRCASHCSNSGPSDLFSTSRLSRPPLRPALRLASSLHFKFFRKDFPGEEGNFFNPGIEEMGRLANQFLVFPASS